MSGDNERLRAIQQELDGILEARITDLMTSIKSLREVTTRIATTELDIRRQEAMKQQLESELGPLENRAESLNHENAEIQAKVEQLRDTVQRMKKLREELMSNLSGLTGEMKGLTGGS